MFSQIKYYSPAGIARSLPHTSINVSRYNNFVRKKLLKARLYEQNLHRQPNEPTLKSDSQLSSRSKHHHSNSLTNSPMISKTYENAATTQIEPFKVEQHNSGSLNIVKQNIVAKQNGSVETLRINQIGVKEINLNDVDSDDDEGKTVDRAQESTPTSRLSGTGQTLDCPYTDSFTSSSFVGSSNIKDLNLSSSHFKPRIIDKKAFNFPKHLKNRSQSISTQKASVIHSLDAYTNLVLAEQEIQMTKTQKSFKNHLKNFIESKKPCEVTKSKRQIKPQSQVVSSIVDAINST